MRETQLIGSVYESTQGCSRTSGDRRIRRLIPAARSMILAGLAAVTCGGLLFSGSIADPAGAALALDESPCVVSTSRRVSRPSLAIGETIDVTTTASFVCPDDMFSPLHTVIVLDASGSMAGAALDDAKSGILALVDTLGLGSDGGSKVGLVAFDDAIRASCPLTTERTLIEACLDRVEARGGSAIDLSLAEAHRLLLEGRRDVEDADNVREVIILLSEGASTGGCEPDLLEAQRIKSQGVLVTTVAIGSSSDSTCLRQIASSPRYFFETVESSALIGAIEAIRESIASVIKRVELTDHLTEAMRYVPGSASPEATVDPISGALSWTMPFVAADGIAVTFKLEAKELGTHPTSFGSVLDFTDVAGDIGSVDLDIESVEIVEASPRPPAPEVEVSLNLERSDLEIGGRSTGTLGIEVDVLDIPGRTHLMLVLDTSGSMKGDAHRLQQEGVHDLLDRMESVADEAFKAGVAQYSAMANILCELTDDFPALHACVDLLIPAGGTSISSGLVVGHNALRDGRPAPGQEDVVLMTDGANSMGCGPVHEQANNIKDEGTILHTICLGPGCDRRCLSRVATSPSHFHDYPTLPEFESAFSEIADEILSVRPVESVSLEIAMPDHLAFDTDGFSIEPDEINVGFASWRLERLMRPALAIHFSFVALAAGEGAPSASADVGFFGGSRRVERADAPSVVVDDPAVPSPETPTAVPATESPPPIDRRIYLPVALSESCVSWHPADIALVLDTSLSMGETGPDGLTKLESAKAAIRALLGGVQPGRDRVGLVTFDDTARILRAPTGQLELVEEAMAGITLGPNTAIDEGIDTAHRMLLNARATADPVPGVSIILLLTDGRPFPAPSSLSIEAAARARADGIVFFVVGLGSEVDEPALRSISGDEHSYRAADGRAELIAAFRTVARWIDCGPPRAFWGRRSIR